jgi:hypothetical protein
MQRISQATAIVVRAWGLETVLPSTHGLLILATRAMSDASLSVEFDRIALAEVGAFNKAVDDHLRTGSVQHECVFTELSRRMNIVRNVSNSKHVYSGWRNISRLVETWSDRDLWEAAIQKELSEKASSAPSAAGQASNGTFMFQCNGRGNLVRWMVAFAS